MTAFRTVVLHLRVRQFQPRGLSIKQKSQGERLDGKDGNTRVVMRQYAAKKLALTRVLPDIAGYCRVTRLGDFQSGVGPASLEWSFYGGKDWAYLNMRKLFTVNVLQSMMQVIEFSWVGGKFQGFSDPFQRELVDFQRVNANFGIGDKLVKLNRYLVKKRHGWAALGRFSMRRAERGMDSKLKWLKCYKG